MRISVLASIAITMPSAAADVIVVAANGSGDYEQINQAIVAASDGDTLLVKTGTYSPFVVPDLALAIVADEGATVQIDGYAAVAELSAGKTVLLSGITARARLPVHRGLYLDGDAGAVRVRDCTFVGYRGAPSECSDDGGSHVSGGDAVSISDCDDVAITACEILGGDGGGPLYWSQCYFDYGGWGGTGMVVRDSRVTLYDSNVRGGTGGSAAYGGTGGTSTRLEGATELFASGGLIRGGQAGDTWEPNPPCGQGGTGLWLGQGTETRLLEMSVYGGLPGDCFAGGNDNGAPYEGPGILLTYPGSARTVTTSRVQREGTAAQVTFRGEPGERAWLCASYAAQYRHEPLLQGTLLLGPPSAIKLAGVIANGGALFYSLPMPRIPAPLESCVLHLQGLFDGSVDGTILGSSTQVVVVDAAF